ncbi:hypothetical protein B4135_1423 [Caldibacillus debilis]|uniref:Uncharacterized protein n=1 Tax=Caldibacillus debilis TaxID=301148 RepID=A0A150MCE8_9BACI|nr:hypothetical protein B4135_1423 [Caldibacillus debilis]
MVEKTSFPNKERGNLPPGFIIHDSGKNLIRPDRTGRTVCFHESMIGEKTA